MTYLSNFNYDKLLKVIKEVQSNTKYFHSIKEVGDNIMVSCPYHKGGLERKPSCGINIHDLVYHCFSCGAAGSFFDMMQDIYMPIDEARIKSDRDEVSIFITDRNQKVEDTPIVHLDYTVGLTKYLQGRQLTQEICKRYAVGYKDDLVVFPTRDMHGEIIFYVTRNVYKKEYTLSKDEKPIYGLYELFRDNEKVDYCFIVESPINALTLAVWGFKAIALMGTGSHNQMKQLKDLPIREYILCFDGDDAGRKATQKFKDYLTNKFITPVFIYEGKDINDLNKEEFSNLLKEHNIVEEDLL